MAENAFKMKGRNADEYFRITQKEYLEALKEIGACIAGYDQNYPFSDPAVTIEIIRCIVKKTIGGRI